MQGKTIEQDVGGWGRRATTVAVLNSNEQNRQAIVEENAGVHRSARRHGEVLESGWME